MMHGILAFDKEGKLLSPFETWRNSNTEQAADALTNEFQFNIPLRWTISHIYQMVLEDRSFVKEIMKIIPPKRQDEQILAEIKENGNGGISLAGS